MSKYIEREVAIKAIEDYGKGLTALDPVEDTTMIAGAIKRLPGINQWLDWHASNEALPENDERVLVIVNGEYGKYKLVDALEIGVWYPDAKVWYLDSVPYYDSVKVDYWADIPMTPVEEEKMEEI